MIPRDKIVIYKNKEVTLGYAIDHCQIGETIGDIDLSLYDEIISYINEKEINKKRNKLHRYGVDDKYGKWRLILLPAHKPTSRVNGYFLDKNQCPELPQKITPIPLY